MTQPTPAQFELANLITALQLANRMTPQDASVVVSRAIVKLHSIQEAFDHDARERRTP